MQQATGVRALTERERQELHLFLYLSERLHIQTATRLALLTLGVLGQYGRTGTFYVTELGRQVAVEQGLQR